MPIDAATIERLGWRQGSIFTLDASRPLVLANRNLVVSPGYEIPDDARLLLISHDCDIVHSGLYEPRIEVCPAVRLPELDGNFTGTRNPRRLHLHIEVAGTPTAHELRASTRFVLPREVLENSAPDPIAQIATRHHGHMRHWLAKRVFRTALPTSFDGRIDNQLRTRIRAILRPLQDSIDSILIDIDPEDVELPAERTYAVQLVALMDTAEYADANRRDAVEAAMLRIQRLFDACPGLELDACVCESMALMSVDTYRQFSIWDYDVLSLDANTNPPNAIP